MQPLANLLLGWVLLVTWASAYTVPLRGLADAAAARKAQRFQSRPLAALIGPHERILAEDTLPEVCRGQTPTLLDSFMFARQVQAHPERAQALLRRIQEQRFDWILTRRPIDVTAADNDFVRNMGPNVIEAIRTNYALQVEADGYFVFAPRRPEVATVQRGK